jgi:hypothetical protein
MRWLLLVLLLQDADVKTLQQTRRTLRETKAASAAARVAAHEALDRGDYDVAVAQHKKSAELGAKAAELKKSEEKLAGEAAAALVRLLMDDDIDVRERAATQLVVVGPAAVKLLEAVRAGGDVEVRGRVDRVLRLLRDIEVDDENRLRQWAVSAKASSQYSDDAHSAKQATGKPDTHVAGDQRTAWAQSEADAGEEWLELTYEVAVRPLRVRIHEACVPGAVVRVEACDAAGKWHDVWKGADPTKDAPGWFELDVDVPGLVVKTVRVTLNTAAVAGWNEIDAVELIGAPAVKK